MLKHTYTNKLAMGSVIFPIYPLTFFARFYFSSTSI